ncbi:Outer membrane protein/protective antigen OMA87 [Prochlorococcus marinus str. MIT 9201]|uniref:Outer membrane protein/protective antigen OMA87 n=1 Tax=Prochlorococcus marinus str. MIT 9201 TaxID=93057 RepID=A0A0A2A842_PROMR|nr:BamA/TamA family outer membrane protein [Prochlorococcus marinus]KGF96573.1 Outer membrane protein/protective antigen OMA87 [Prochlorococcus marinus str. MIT 9201]
MQKHFLRFSYLFTNIAFYPLILISNHSELAAKYLQNDIKKSIKTLEINNTNIGFLQSLDTDKQKNFFIAENTENINEESVLISEIIIEGWENHPEGRKLELAAYDSMSIKPGSIVDNQTLNQDLKAIYASGWFSGVQIKSQEGPLGVRLIVNVVPNPILKKVKLRPENSVISSTYVDKIFNNFYGTTLNLNELQNKIAIIKKRYEIEGYSLARINGPDRISENGIVTLNVTEGIVSDIKLRFIGSDGESLKDGKPRKGKTKDWVIKRELKTQPGTIFNRKILEADIGRLYATSLFDDVKVSLGPDKLNPGKVIIFLDLSEQRTGSLTGGLGYSNSSGIFASLGLQETNALGRAWSTNLNLNFGEYSTTYNFSLSDPWIKGDKHKTSFRTNIFLSRDYPQEFKSEDNGRIYAVDDTNTSTSDSFSSIVLEKTGGGFSFSRPLNGGDTFKPAKWRVLAGMNFKKVKMIDGSGNKKPYGDMTPTSGNINDIICIGFTPNEGTCPEENTLVSVIASTSRNNLNNSANPTSGNKFTFGTEQFVSMGENSPTFNRMRASYSFFIPTKLINLTKACRSSNAASEDCPQAIGFQFKTGTILGELPPYEAFCMGGTSSVRGWGSCDLGVSKSFVESTVEYRFPVWRMISGALFVDAGSDLGSQKDVPGKPGKLLQKSGSGFSLGGGVGVKTPIGPLRFDVASKDLSGEWRYTLGVGWKF